MKNRKIRIRTKRLNLYPLSDAEIRELIDRCQEAEQKAAYEQMLEGCRNNPEQRHWYAPWAMETKKDRTRIGDVGFKGPVSDCSVEIGYGIEKEYEGRGYTTEAVKALVDWAIDNNEILFIEAEASVNNAASIHILEKLGFKKYAQGEEGPRFVRSKPETCYISLGICLGMCLGMSFGMLFYNNSSIGMCVGLVIGLALGSAKDKKIKDKKAEIERRKYQ